MHYLIKQDLCVLIKILLRFVSIWAIDTMPALVQIMDWNQPGNKLFICDNVVLVS